MRKFIGFISILALILLAKLSYDLYWLSQRSETLQQSILQVEQNNANLNDQLISLQRQLATVSAHPSAKPDIHDPVMPVLTGLSPVIVIRQQLELSQFALQQHQYIFAMDKLNQLDQALPSYALAPALEYSLHESLNKDKQNIQQFVLAKNQQQQLFDDLIQLLDKDLQQAQQIAKVNLNRKQRQHFWEGWFQIERVDRIPADLVNRRIILKEVQLRLLLARQALNEGHLTEYQHILNLATQQLAQLPDASSQQFMRRLDRLKQLPNIPVPKLVTLELLG